MEWDYPRPDSLELAPHGLFIVNEGNFQYGNASLSFYDPTAGQVENGVFSRANAMKLGDVAQSMTLHGGLGWIVVNNSHVIFAIDPATGLEKGRIENLTSPRFIFFVDDSKAYVTQLWDNRIFIVDPRTFSVTGHITVPGMTMESGSTEQMVRVGDYVYCNCWSYQNRIIRIDPRTDRVTAELTVGIQPAALTADALGRLWTVTDGGYAGSPYGHEAPALFCIDPVSFAVERRFDMAMGSTPSELQVSADGLTLFWLDSGVWSMDVTAASLPSAPLIEGGERFYGLTVSPADGDIYVADAIDYQQAGIIYRYGADGTLLDRFYAGINPGAFCWK